MTGSAEFKAWCDLRRRCSDPKVRNYHRYGGRGIRVCLAFDRSFEAFFSAVGARPGPAFSIDRVNNDGHYSCGKCDECIANGWPANCRWATKGEQLSNKSDNLLLKIGNREQTAAEWADERGIDRALVYERLERGWTPEEALDGSGCPARWRCSACGQRGHNRRTCSAQEAA
jgi:hypothetical protein